MKNLYRAAHEHPIALDDFLSVFSSSRFDFMIVCQQGFAECGVKNELRSRDFFGKVSGRGQVQCIHYPNWLN